MNRTAGLIIGLVLAFVIVVIVLVEVMPGPLERTDYLVIGGAATLFCLALLFFLSRKVLPKPPGPRNPEEP